MQYKGYFTTTSLLLSSMLRFLNQRFGETDCQLV